MSDAPPPIPTEFQVYNSYVVDPVWQRTFSIVWAAVAVSAILISFPRLLKSFKNGQALTSVTGVWEDLRGRAYEPVAAAPPSARAKKTQVKRGKSGIVEKAKGWVSKIKSFALWTAPLVGLDLGQIVLVVAYYILLLLCITLQSELIDNPNRAGFMAIAQLPVIFLLSTKNSPLSMLLGAGHGWEKLNFLHRWSGRGAFLAAAVHGSLWIRNHLQYGLPILGQQKETSGVAAFALLCVIVLSSLKIVRMFAYQVFFVVHILALVAFFITLCYHTIYAVPYIFPPLAFYGFDLLLRMFRFRVKDATMVAADNQMTIIRVNDCDGGWVAGQHVRLRVFIGARVFESHPLTIMSAPPRSSCLNDRSLLLGARVRGDWTRALNAYARENAFPVTAPPPHPADHVATVAISEEVVLESIPLSGPSKAGTGSSTEKEIIVPEKAGWTTAAGAPVQVMLDGPYGGGGIDLGDFERVLLVAGGSGITFTLGLLDDIVGRCVRLGRPNGERTKRVEFAWCVRSFGSIHWVAPLLTEIALLAETSSLDLHITVFVTCLCDPEAVPPIPNCDVLLERPSVHRMVESLVRGDDGGFHERGVKEARTLVEGGGLAVCSAGPETMVREAKNVTARLALTQAHRLGEVSCHTEVYSL
ncbi:iron reductase [Phellopilus nigrolimitatus]|nr:iron reductase [Phellopilus nigrolimitatus]